MKVVVQRSLSAKCSVDGVITGEINHGLMILVGFTHTDAIDNCIKMASKVAKLRIFDDSEGKMNLSIKDVGGSILSISQFTLYADASGGNRPSFTNAMNPLDANKLYEAFNLELEKCGLKVEKGIFQAHMEISFTNDGPVTIILEN